MAVRVTVGLGRGGFVRDDQLAAQALLLLLTEGVHLGGSREPVLAAAGKDAIERQPGGAGAGQEGGQVVAAAFENLQGILQLREHAHELLQRFAVHGDDGSPFLDRQQLQARALQAARHQLGVHVLGGLHIANVLLLRDLVEGRPGHVDVAVLDQAQHLGIWR